MKTTAVRLRCMYMVRYETRWTVVEFYETALICLRIEKEFLNVHKAAFRHESAHFKH